MTGYQKGSLMRKVKSMPVNKKAEYVKGAQFTGGHTCHWPGCKTEVKPALWGCAKHWFKLPSALRNKVWAAYKPGQEITKTPSAEYLAVAHEVQSWVDKNGHRL